MLDEENIERGFDPSDKNTIIKVYKLFIYYIVKKKNKFSLSDKIDEEGGNLACC
jgi:hypothetical protein